MDTIIIPPGVTIVELLQDRNISRKQFAEKLNRPVSYIDDLLLGTTKLTDSIAGEIASILSMKAKFLLNLETLYRNQLKEAGCEHKMLRGIVVKEDGVYEISRKYWQQYCLEE